MSAVKLDSVEKWFGETQVLRGVSLDIEAGEVVAIIGRSGSGKSTLLRCINALESYDVGYIAVEGQRVDSNSGDLRALREKVGMVFQSFNLFPHLTAGENVMLAPRIVKKKSREEVRDTAMKVLDKVGLQDRFDAYPEQLSGGQQQRVAIARSLAMSTRVLLCDEITSALDPELVGEVLRVLESLAADGMTLILVTHEMGFARDVANRVVLMHNGQVHESGSPQQIFNQPGTPELQQFLRSVG